MSLHLQAAPRSRAMPPSCWWTQRRQVRRAPRSHLAVSAGRGPPACTTVLAHGEVVAPATVFSPAPARPYPPPPGLAKPDLPDPHPPPAGPNVTWVLVLSDEFEDEGRDLSLTANDSRWTSGGWVSLLLLLAPPLPRLPWSLSLPVYPM